MQSDHIGQCALCRCQAELKMSHIVPSFVAKWFKDTSTGGIRSTDQPNRPRQDIEKYDMLCHDCEERFSAKERWFANHIFFPYQNDGIRAFEYDENLTYFITSVNWRSLYCDLNEFSCSPDFDKDILMTLFRAEGIMRDYLLGKRVDIGSIQNHMFFLDRVQSASGFQGKALSAAMHRNICAYTHYAGDTSFSIANMAGILALSFYSMDDREKWVNTRVQYDGVLEAKDQRMTSVVGQELHQWTDLLEQAQKELSPTQKAKIVERLRKVGDKLHEYPIYQDYLDDRNLR